MNTNEWAGFGTVCLICFMVCTLTFVVGMIVGANAGIQPLSQGMDYVDYSSGYGGGYGTYESVKKYEPVKKVNGYKSEIKNRIGGKEYEENKERSEENFKGF